MRYATFFCSTSIHFVSSAILEQFETVNQAINFIAASPCLEDITLESVHCESCNYSSQAIPPTLKRIKFERLTPLDIIMDWIHRCHPTPSVHTLEILRLCEDDDIPIVCKFIRHLGSALENLTIGCLYSDWTEEIQSKCISDPYFIDASLITLIRCPEQWNRSVPEYLPSEYLLRRNIHGSTPSAPLWLDYSHHFYYCSLLFGICIHRG